MKSSALLVSYLPIKCNAMIAECDWCDYIAPDYDLVYDHIQISHPDIDHTIEMMFELIDVWEDQIEAYFGGDLVAYRQHLVEIHKDGDYRRDIVELYDNYVEHVRDIYLEERDEWL